MKYKFSIIIFFFLFVATVVTPILQARETSLLTVAYAANLQYAIKDLEKEFYKQYPNIRLRLLSGASGKHNAQIRNGAPIDMFLSADFDFPYRLYKDNLTLTKPKTYARGQVVLWTMRNIQINEKTLLLKEIKKISLANPKIAPYGKATIEILKNNNMFKQVQHKLVYGENAAIAVAYVYSKAADIGFVPKSTVLAPSMKGKGKWKDIDTNLYKPIEQAMVILKYAKKSKNEKNAFLFWEFLLSKEAKKNFMRHGYK